MEFPHIRTLVEPKIIASFRAITKTVAVRMFEDSCTLPEESFFFVSDYFGFGHSKIVITSRDLASPIAG